VDRENATLITRDALSSMQISLPALPFRSFDQRANAVASRALTRICDLRNSGEQRKIEDVCVRQIREKRRGGGKKADETRGKGGEIL